MKRLFVIILCALSLHVFAASWKTHFGYADVTQIAMGKERVYGLSQGLLFSVDKNSEHIKEWTKARGMYGGEIGQIGYDEVTDILLVAYATGRMDLIQGTRITHLSDFYNKDMTSLKRANAITFHNGRAYMSMEFGILSFDMRKHEFIDTYYIGDEAGEVFVEDVVIQGDSIYAFAAENMYAAALKDNLVDYRVWKLEAITSRVQRDPNKGVRYVDINNDEWTAGHDSGIVRKFVTGEQVAYKPAGPQTNIPYSLSCADDGTLYMLSGGRWASQFHRPGDIMFFRNGKWTNIPQATIQAKTGKLAEDFIDVAVDPHDMNHYFVTSFGTGLYECQGSTILQRYDQTNSSLTPVLPENPDRYTRCVNAVFDAQGNLSLIATSPTGPTVVTRTKDGVWGGTNILVDGIMQRIYTPAGMLIDVHNPNWKWINSGRKTTALIRYDNNGTFEDTSDDSFILRTEWIDQYGRTIAPTDIYDIMQDKTGNLWLATPRGLVILPAEEDFATSNKCLSLPLTESDGDILMEKDGIVDLCVDNDGNIWCGTEARGVFVLSPGGNELLNHYTSDNTIMPTDAIMALACDPTTNRIYIGTGLGLVSYSNSETDIDASSQTYDTDNPDYGTMHSWSLYPAYSHVSAVTASHSDVYALSEGALFSANRTDESLTCYSKLTGLSGSNILFISYNNTVDKLLIVYQNGMMDVMDTKGLTALSDLFLKGETTEMVINSITTFNQFVYFAMSFGIVVMDMSKNEIADTYYIGKNASDVNVQSIAVFGDSVYAVTPDYLYTGALKDALIDYANWRISSIPQSDDNIRLASTDSHLYLLCNNILYRREAAAWKKQTAEPVKWIRGNGKMLLAATERIGLVEIDAAGTMTTLTDEFETLDALYDNGEYWLAADQKGLLRYKQNSYQAFQPDGPLSNLSCNLQFFGDRLMMAQGGGWASQYKRRGDVIFYDYTAKKWDFISADQTIAEAGREFLDVMDYAVDANDINHIFAPSYGNGVAEFRDGHLAILYNETNSFLRSSLENDERQAYVRTVGATYDRHGNMWVINAGSRGYTMNILDPDGKWHVMNFLINGQKPKISTPRGILVDRKYPNSKWFFDGRSTTGLMVWDDGGTPFNQSDDHMLKRSDFVDQLGTAFTPANMFCVAQDHNGPVWVGTEAGPFIVESVESFLSSNKATRPIIYRNDGTNLVDYLLHAEQINALCVDGGNRKWIGTAGSGLFLMSEDGTETIYHFTTDNSPLPSDEILAIAIHPVSGEVFIGTAKGLASFHSDASEPTENYDEVYAYPNPVRPNYEGVITITGLMDNTVVYITDAAGNLVCKTKSNGGIAVWDGKNLRGQRVATGVYSVLCNTADGENHAVTKILVTH